MLHAAEAWPLTLNVEFMTLRKSPVIEVVGPSRKQVTHRSS
jgi:hypothetical protein